MNKLKTNINDQFPLFLDDLRWIDDGLRDAFKAVFAAYGEDRFIISGCQLTYDSGSVSYICTEGYIYFNGEILYCTGGTALSDETNVPVFGIQVSYTQSVPGLKTFGDGSVHDTYEIRRALYHTINPNDITGELIAITAKRLHELIYSNIIQLPERVAEMALYAKKQQEAWTVVTPGQEFVLSSIPDAEKLSYRKDEFGQVQLLGSIMGGTDPSGGDFCQIPYTPLTDRFFPVYVDNSSALGSRDILACWLETDGKVRIRASDGTVNPGGTAFINATIPLN